MLVNFSLYARNRFKYFKDHLLYKCYAIRYKVSRIFLILDLTVFLKYNFHLVLKCIFYFQLYYLRVMNTLQSVSYSTMKTDCISYKMFFQLILLCRRNNLWCFKNNRLSQIDVMGFFWCLIQSIKNISIFDQAISFKTLRTVFKTVFNVFRRYLTPVKCLCSMMQIDYVRFKIFHTVNIAGKQPNRIRNITISGTDWGPASVR